MHSVHSLHWGSCGEHPVPIKNKDGVASMYTVHWLSDPSGTDLSLPFSPRITSVIFAYNLRNFSGKRFLF